MRPARSLEVFEGTGPGKIGEDPAQGMIGLEAAGLTGFDEAIEVGGGLGAPATLSWKSQLRRLTQKGRRQFSVALLSIGMRPSVRYKTSLSHSLAR